MIRNNKLSMESENEDKLLTLINLEQIELFDQQAQFRNQESRLQASGLLVSV